VPPRERGEFAYEFLRAVAERGIECLLIGRQAVALYGAPVGSVDVDIFLAAPDAEAGIRKLVDEFELTDESTESKRVGFFRRKKIRLSRFRDPIQPGTIEIFRQVDVFMVDSLYGLNFKEAWRRSVPVELSPGIAVRIPHVDDLIRLKRAAGRSKDREDIGWLKRNRDRLLQP